MGIDLYKHQQRYENWKAQVVKSGEDGLNKINSDLMIKYLIDMELGQNTAVGSVKGSRSYPQLNKLRQRLAQFIRMMQSRGISDVRKTSSQQLALLFTELRQGKITTHDGEKYKSVPDFAKVFKAFWHWWMKINRKQNRTILDITEDIDSTPDEKPHWVYLNEKQMDSLINKARPSYKTLLSFLYDSGFRVSETFSIQAQDITEENGAVYVNLKEENSKTFGRKIKLLLSGKQVLDYIKANKLQPGDMLFSNHPSVVNRYLKELADKLFGTGSSKAGKRYSSLKMYDLRHNSVCYWLPRYKTQANLMYRFGWKSEKYVHYYSEFLGLKDTIRNEDLYVDITKTELEKNLETLQNSQDKMKAQQDLLIDTLEAYQEITHLLINEVKGGKPSPMLSLVENNSNQLAELIQNKYGKTKTAK